MHTGSSLKTQENHHCLGHRQRLKARFLSAPESLADYELLESFLFLSLPRADTKPLAKELLKHFQSLGGVLGAGPEKLSALKGMGPHAVYAVKLVETLLHRLLKEKLSRVSLLDNMDRVVRYCRATMAQLKVEQFRVFFLDSKGSLLADECQQKGTVDHTALYPREIMKRALALDAASLVVAHNHPSGYATPSKADKDVTQHLRRLSHEMGLRLIDHIIIGKYEWYSFKAQGLL